MLAVLAVLGQLGSRVFHQVLRVVMAEVAVPELVVVMAALAVQQVQVVDRLPMARVGTVVTADLPVMVGMLVAVEQATAVLLPLGRMALMVAKAVVVVPVLQVVWVELLVLVAKQGLLDLVAMAEMLVQVVTVARVRVLHPVQVAMVAMVEMLVPVVRVARLAFKA